MRSHAQLNEIENVWPDKTLYGSIMLLVSASVGFIYAGFVTVFDIAYSKNVPKLLVATPSEWTLLLSGVAAALAYVSFRKLSPGWGMIGGVAGILSMGMLGLGALFSLIALAFLVKARLEGEDTALETRDLGPEDWPDKSLAASLLLLMTAVVSGLWGYGLVAGSISMGTFGRGFGIVGLLATPFCLSAAYTLYHQRASWLGFVAAVFGIVSFGAYVLGPLFSIAALILLVQARGEGEFNAPPRAGRPSAP